MNQPPIPFIEPYHCQNCGHPLRELVEICPQCGARIETTRYKPPWLNYLMITALALMMIPLGLAGACFLAFTPAGGIGVIEGDKSDFWSIVISGGIGLALLGGAVLCGFGIKKLKK